MAARVPVAGVVDRCGGSGGCASVGMVGWCRWSVMGLCRGCRGAWVGGGDGVPGIVLASPSRRRSRAAVRVHAGRRLRDKGRVCLACRCRRHGLAWLPACGLGASSARVACRCGCPVHVRCLAHAWCVRHGSRRAWREEALRGGSPVVRCRRSMVSCGSEGKAGRRCRVPSAVWLRSFSVCVDGANRTVGCGVSPRVVRVSAVGKRAVPGVSRSLSSGWMMVFPRRRQVVPEVVSVCGCRDWWRPAWTAGCHHVCAYIMAGRCHCPCGNIMAPGHPARGLAPHYSCRNSMARCLLCVQSEHGWTSIVRAMILCPEYPIFAHEYNGRTPVMRAVMVWPHVHCSCMDIMVPGGLGASGGWSCLRALEGKKRARPGMGRAVLAWSWPACGGAVCPSVAAFRPALAAGLSGLWLSSLG